jgi:hypothetical protein
MDVGNCWQQKGLRHLTISWNLDIMMYAVSVLFIISPIAVLGLRPEMAILEGVETRRVLMWTNGDRVTK